MGKYNRLISPSSIAQIQYASPRMLMEDDSEISVFMNLLVNHASEGYKMWLLDIGLRRTEETIQDEVESVAAGKGRGG